MKYIFSRLIIISLFILTSAASNAAIPLMLPYSGNMLVDGEAFNGTGNFKFVIVNQECVSGVGTCLSLWSNDASSTGASEPTLSIPLTVNAGKYSVKLGNISITNMTSIPVATFDRANTYLRVWFDDGISGSQLLTPDRQLVSVPYAHRAAVADSLSSGNGGGLPVGSIIDWWRPSNSTASIPEGFEICDGRPITNPLSIMNGENTPDLTDQFVRGVDSLNRIGEIGGNDTHKHTTILDHDHASAPNATSTAGVHNHTVDIPDMGMVSRNSTTSGTHGHIIDLPLFIGNTDTVGSHNHQTFRYQRSSRRVFDGANNVIANHASNSGLPDLDSNLTDKVVNIGGCNPCFMPIGFPNRTSFSLNTDLAGSHKHRNNHDHPAFASQNSGDHSHTTNIGHNHPLANSSTTGGHQHDVDLPAYIGSRTSGASNNIPSYVGLLKLIKIY